MRDIKGMEEVLEALRPHMPTIEAHFNKENEHFKSLIAENSEFIGKILQCHLIIEFYLDRFISNHYSIDDIEKLRMTFYQKSLLLPDKASAAAFIKPGIIELNKVRNKYAHDLGYVVTYKDITVIKDIIGVGNPRQTFDKPIDLIEYFTTMACAWLIMPPKELQDVFVKAFANLVVHS